MNAMILTFALALQVPPQPQPIASTTITQAHRLSQEELKQLAHKERAAQIIKNRNRHKRKTKHWTSDMQVIDYLLWYCWY